MRRGLVFLSWYYRPFLLRLILVINCRPNFRVHMFLESLFRGFSRYDVMEVSFGLLCLNTYLRRR